jgi:hypothetical protein
MLGQPVIPGERSETRNPGRKTWIPAYAGMTDMEAPSVSAHLLSAQHSGQLRMTRPADCIVKYTNIVRFDCVIQPHS